MAVDKNDAERKSKVWKNITRIATIVIIVVAAYFIYRGFWGNPLEGKWYHDDSDMVLEIKSGDVAYLYSSGTPEVKAALSYSIETKEKEVTFRVDQDKLDKNMAEASDDNLAADVESMVHSMTTTYHYSIENNKMELTEWDYGDQLVFSVLQ